MSWIKILELRGIQAAGKTTLARKLTAQDPRVVRVNRDDLRAMLRGDVYMQRHEPVVKACEAACAVAAAREGYSVVIDDVNLPGNNFWRTVASLLGVPYENKTLHISVEEAIERDAQRLNPIGAAAIRATAKRCQIIPQE